MVHVSLAATLAIASCGEGRAHLSPKDALRGHWRQAGVDLHFEETRRIYTEPEDAFSGDPMEYEIVAEEPESNAVEIVVHEKGLMKMADQAGWAFETSFDVTYRCEFNGKRTTMKCTQRPDSMFSHRGAVEEWTFVD